VCFAESAARAAVLRLQHLGRPYHAAATRPTPPQLPSISCGLEPTNAHLRPRLPTPALLSPPAAQASLFEWVRETYGVGMDQLRAELLAGVTKTDYNQHTLEVNALAGAGREGEGRGESWGKLSWHSGIA